MCGNLPDLIRQPIPPGGNHSRERLKSVGDKTEPCRTPQDKSSSDTKLPLTAAPGVQLIRNNLNHCKGNPTLLAPNISTGWHGPPCQRQLIKPSNKNRVTNSNKHLYVSLAYIQIWAHKEPPSGSHFTATLQSFHGKRLTEVLCFRWGSRVGLKRQNKV